MIFPKDVDGLAQGWTLKESSISETKRLVKVHIHLIGLGQEISQQPKNSLISSYIQG